MHVLHFATFTVCYFFVAMHVLQCLQCVAMCAIIRWLPTWQDSLQCITVCCSVLTCVAVCCSVCNDSRGSYMTRLLLGEEPHVCRALLYNRPTISGRILRAIV